MSSQDRLLDQGFHERRGMLNNSALTKAAGDDGMADAIAAMRDSVADVLTTECDSRAVHGFIDGKSIDGSNALDQVLWRHAGELGWLGAGIPEAMGGVG